MPPVKTFSSENIRCCTLVGHVDHGKSSFADSLLATNGIISSRSAGQVRYMDSREDEQERGITMKSSAVSLTFKLRTIQKDGSVDAIQDYTLNLIDTPGHVDFSSEVSTAARLCDGALVIVDVVEGVCAQTVNVLRQAWLDGLRTVLVVNKMDRLITELKLTPTEAHHRLLQLLEQVNAVIGGFYAAERMEQDQRWYEERERLREEKEQLHHGELPQDHTADETDLPEHEEYEDADLYFDPARGNVIFASAVDHWAFRLERFSHMYAQKLGIKEDKIRQFLWGHYYLDPKTKRVLSQKQHDREKRVMKPMFVQFVLDNIWSVYEHTVMERDQDMIDKIIATLQLSIHPRDMRAKEPAMLMQAIMSQWLPLSACTFNAIVRCLPSPAEAQMQRVPRMIRPELGFFASDSELAPTNDLERDLFRSRSGPEAVTVAYVSKMFAVPKEDMPECKRVQLTADEMRERGRLQREAMASTGAEAAASAPNTHEDADETPREEEDGSEEVILGFARLYSGSVSVGETVWAILPKYDPSHAPSDAVNQPYIRECKIQALYMMMGRDLIAVQRVPAGNVFAIRGLDGVVLRNGTLMRAPHGAQLREVVNLAGMKRHATPIVRVALEPRSAADMPRLAEGLKLLNQADPCVEVLVQENGEHVILTAGELHLERCLRDLRERFARCAIQSSPPLVPFRETCVKAANLPPPKTPGASRGTIEGTALQGAVVFTIRAVPMPSLLTDFLVMNVPTIRRMLRRSRRHDDQIGGSGDHDDDDDDDDDGQDPNANGIRNAQVQSESIDHIEHDEDADLVRRVSVRLFWDELAKVLQRAGTEWAGLAAQICAFGPKHVGPNLLLDPQQILRRSLMQRIQAQDSKSQLAVGMQHISLSSTGAEDSTPRLEREWCDAIEAGFQLASGAGPLCAESMQGVAFFVQNVRVDQDALGDARAKSSQMASMVISSVRESCRQGMLDWSPRLLLAMYSCDIQAAPEVQGKVHAVLSRRRGRIVSEEIKEGTLFFTIGALLPVVESFGFAEEIRKRTSGAANPQLFFAGFQLFDEDPLWVPRTEEELEDLGEKGDRENIAKRYMDMVRKRKGLKTDKRIVASAEKQRTLKSM